MKRLYAAVALVTLVALAFLAGPHAFATAPAGEEPGITSQEAMRLLVEGNARYSSWKAESPNVSFARLTETAAKGQHPIATVLACSDSRVPVERIFDRGIGDIFVVRVAGNVCGTDEVASLEYGVDHLGTRLLIVLGHTNCGAVMAALSKGEAHGNLPALLDKIAPAVASARKKNPGLADKDLVCAAVIANVWQSIADMYKSSAILREKARSGALTVVGAVYDIANGKVTFLGAHPDQEKLLSTGPATDLHGDAATSEPAKANKAASGTSHEDTVAPANVTAR